MCFSHDPYFNVSGLCVYGVLLVVYRVNRKEEGSSVWFFSSLSILVEWSRCPCLDGWIELLTWELAVFPCAYLDLKMMPATYPT